jgi:hypothetical protein
MHSKLASDWELVTLRKQKNKEMETSSGLCSHGMRRCLTVEEAWI